MLSKLVALFMSVIMFFSTSLPAVFKSPSFNKELFSIAAEIEEYIDKKMPAIAIAVSRAGEAFTASAIEFTVPCTIIYSDGSKASALYVDFNGNNGYFVMDNDKIIYAYSSEGGFAEFEGRTDLCYIQSSGFGFIDEEGYITQHEHNDNSVDNKSSFDYFEDFFNYETQDGSILPDKSDEYIKYTYGSGYECTSYKSLKNFDYITQNDTSIYYKPVENGYLTESNCVANSITAFLLYLSKQSGDTVDNIFSKIPSSDKTTLVKATDDYFFEKYRNLGYYIKGYDSEKQTCDGCMLYDVYKLVRDITVLYYGYETGGLSPKHIPDIINSMLLYYGVNNNQIQEYQDFFTFVPKILPQIKNGYPAIWSVYNSTTYSDHTTCVTGYKIYTKTVKARGMKIVTDVVILLQLNDNWSGEAKMFDYSKFNSGNGYFFVFDNS